MKTVDITIFQQNIDKLLSSVIPNNASFRITVPSGNVILLSQTRYQSLLDSIYLLSQPCLVSRIKEGENEAPSDMETFHFHDSY